MSSADLAVVAVFPTIMWALSVFVSVSTGKLASGLRASLNAKTKEELVDGSSQWAFVGLVQSLLLVAFVICWSRVVRFDELTPILKPTGWGRNTLKGLVIGLALLGLLILLRAGFPQARRFRLIAKTGFASPVGVRVSNLLVLVFSEELWRAICLKALLAEGNSGPLALFIVAAAYGLAYMMLGVTLAVSEAAFGLILGAVFLWTGSLLVPIAAHFIISLQILLAVSAAAPDAVLANLDRKPFAVCPVCRARLGMRQIKFNHNESFLCPACRARLTLSDGYRGFYQWGLAILFVACLFAAWDFFPDIMKGANYWIVLLTMPFLGLGLRVLLLFAFPPRLECGDPNFVRLELAASDKRPASQATTQDKSDSGTN
jgi:membrane protease YdiL (CAAX protease family)